MIPGAATQREKHREFRCLKAMALMPPILFQLVLQSPQKFRPHSSTRRQQSFSEEALTVRSEFHPSSHVPGTPFPAAQLTLFRPKVKVPVFRLPLSNRDVILSAKERRLLLRFRALSPVEEGTLFVRRVSPQERIGFEKICWVSLDTDRWRPDFKATSETLMTEISSDLFAVVIPRRIAHISDHYEFNFDALRGSIVLLEQIDPIYEVVNNGYHVNEVGRIGPDTPYFHRDQAIRELQAITVTSQAQRLINRIWFFHWDSDWEIHRRWLREVPLLKLSPGEALAAFGEGGVHLMLEAIDLLAPAYLSEVQFVSAAHVRKMRRRRSVLGESGAKIDFAARYLQLLDRAGLLENPSAARRLEIARGMEKLSSTADLHWAPFEKGVHIFWQKVGAAWLVFLIDTLREPGAESLAVVPAGYIKSWLRLDPGNGSSLTDVFGSVQANLEAISLRPSGIRVLQAKGSA